MPDTVLVIGSNSFSGADFVDLLLTETPYRVVGVSRSPEKNPLYLAYRNGPNLSRFEFHQHDLNHDMQHLEQLLLDVRP